MTTLLLWFACHTDVAPPPIFEPSPSLVTVPEQAAPRHANALAVSASPYLRLHAHDPVDWLPWGEEAFALARERDVPVFLSVGYFSCHWCHVMHRESFTDPEVAAFLNANFVPIKVDREERPDVDALYMDAVNALNGRGGWPASIWLTPEKIPFYAGTYYPPRASRGRPGFLDVLSEIRGQWSDPEQRQDLENLGQRLAVQLNRAAQRGSGSLPGVMQGELSMNAIVSSWDATSRGWGQRTQFPLTPRLRALADWSAELPVVSPARQPAVDVLVGTLDAMDAGGIHDHLGGGFHRYTVDQNWLIPHFEKMLYDNAQLIEVYAKAASLTGDPRYRAVVEEAVSWLRRELQGPSGALYSSQGAESTGGTEGDYYTWTLSEVTSHLSRPRDFLTVYPISASGNFTGGRAVLHRAPGVDLSLAEPARAQLRSIRARRPPPPTDTKCVVAWNGLAVTGLATAGRLLDRPDYTEFAAEIAVSILDGREADGGLPRILSDPASPSGVLADYAFTAEGLLVLYAATGEPRWLEAADSVASEMSLRFRSSAGGLQLSAADDLIVQQRDAADGSEPSAIGRAALVLLKLEMYGASSADPSLVDEILRAADRDLRRAPHTAPSIAQAVLLANDSVELIVSADDLTDPRAVEMVSAINRRLRPGAVQAALTPSRQVELAAFATIADKGPGNSGVRGYVCYRGVCKAPTSDPEAFQAMIDQP